MSEKNVFFVIAFCRFLSFSVMYNFLSFGVVVFCCFLSFMSCFLCSPAFAAEPEDVEKNGLLLEFLVIVSSFFCNFFNFPFFGAWHLRHAKMTEKNELHTNLNKYRNMTHPDDKKWLNPNENKHDKNDRKIHQNISKYSFQDFQVLLSQVTHRSCMAFRIVRVYRNYFDCILQFERSWLSLVQKD